VKVFGADPNFNKSRVEELKKQDQSVVAKAVKNDAAPAGETGKAAATATNVAVSGFAKDVAKANSVAKNSPDIRKEKVDAIKAKIANGEYHISADKIAGKIVADIARQGK